MPRQNAADDALFGVPVGKAGRVERRVAAAIRSAKADGVVTVIDDGLAAVALELARAVDRSGASGPKPDPYAVTQAGAELRKALGDLRLTPVSRGAATSDALADFLTSLHEDSEASSPTS